MESAIGVRPIDPGSTGEIALVASRMRATLVEVLGAERGGAMYDLDWLKRRVRWHLDPASCEGQVFVAEAASGTIVGHTIVRVEEERDQAFGLFSTTYVMPEARRVGAAKRLLERGELWMRRRGLAAAETWTDPENEKLIRLFEGRGYTLTPAGEMVRLRRALTAAG